MCQIYTILVDTRYQHLLRLMLEICTLVAALHVIVLMPQLLETSKGISAQVERMQQQVPSKIGGSAASWSSGH